MRAERVEWLRAQNRGNRDYASPNPNVPPWLTPTLLGRGAAGLIEERWGLCGRPEEPKMPETHAQLSARCRPNQPQRSSGRAHSPTATPPKHGPFWRGGQRNDILIATFWRKG
jgi:hypothetical protein